MFMLFVFLCLLCDFFCFFFFQAEDGIRDRNVTGVQTCALPIFGVLEEQRRGVRRVERQAPLERTVQDDAERVDVGADVAVPPRPFGRAVLRRRSEERRVGKECRSWGWSEDEKKNDRY